MNIIFLDIDGVLNSLPYFEELKKNVYEDNIKFHEISEFHLIILSKIYHACDAKIVLSSTWRDLDDDNMCKKACEMYQYLVDSLAKYNMSIFSKTPILNYNRPLEIYEWLNSHSDIETINFAILDDDFAKEEYATYNLDNHLVSTRFFCNDISEGGLQPYHIDKAINILKRGKV